MTVRWRDLPGEGGSGFFFSKRATAAGGGELRKLVDLLFCCPEGSAAKQVGRMLRTEYVVIRRYTSHRMRIGSSYRSNYGAFELH